MSERKLTLSDATAIGLGNIIGAGIFVLAGSIIKVAGPGALLSFFLTGVLAITVALNSAELSSKISAHGGLYSFARELMGEEVGFIVGWLRAVSYAIAAPAVAMGFSAYVLSMLRVESAPLLYALTVFLILFATFLNYVGIKLVADIEKVLVVISVLGLIVFIIASFIYGKWTPERFTPLIPRGPFSIISSSSLAFFAYSGFNTVATLVPEMKDGRRDAPKAILLSLGISTLLYILVVAGMLALMPWPLYGTSADPLAVALSFSGAPGVIMLAVSAVAIVATFTVTLSLIVAGSRTLLQMGEDGFLRSVFGGSDEMIGRSVLAIGIIAVLSTFIGNVEFIALASNFGVIFSYALTGLEVYVSRRRNIEGAFYSPLYPYVQILSTVLSLVVMAALGIRALYIGFLTIISELLFYYAEKEFRLSRAKNKI